VLDSIATSETKRRFAKQQSRTRSQHHSSTTKRQERGRCGRGATKQPSQQHKVEIRGSANVPRARSCAMTGGMAVEGGNNVEGERATRRKSTVVKQLRAHGLYAPYCFTQVLLSCSLLFFFLLNTAHTTQHPHNTTPTQLQPHTVHPPTHTPKPCSCISKSLCYLPILLMPYWLLYPHPHPALSLSLSLSPSP
jgi:hypothetical protein